MPEYSPAALGLAVLVHRGVAAWLEIATSPPALPCGGEDTAKGDEMVLARGPLVVCLAQMLLARGRDTA